MRLAAIRRSFAAATAITLLTIPSAFAETVAADGDFVTAGNQTTIDVGTVAPGADVPWYVYFVVTCSGTNHVDANQSVKLTPTTQIAPAGGGYVGVDPLTFALPAGWPADGAACAADVPAYVAGPLYIVLTAPMTEGADRHFRFGWSRTVTPSSGSDTGVFGGSSPQIEFVMNVATPVENTPPELQLPADSTVEGNATGGAAAAYTVTATDAEDAVAPTPSCTPATGSLLPLGTNTISCGTTDSAGLGASGSFHITVVDTSDPVLNGMPGDVSLTTSDPGGTTLSYTPPTATDVVDDAPRVGCSTASGATIPVGDTTVTCTASDASGNTASASFAAHVTLVQTQPPSDPPPSDPQARWDDPVGASAGIVVNGSRSIPVKVWLTLDGTPIRSGHGLLTVASCDGGAPVQTDPVDVQSNGRWMGHVDTRGLTPGCYRVVASVDGQAFGSFRMDVRSGSVPVAKPVKAPVKPHAKPHEKSHVNAPAPHHQTPVAKHSKCRGKP